MIKIHVTKLCTSILFKFKALRIFQTSLCVGEESNAEYNHKIVCVDCVERDLNDHLVPTPVPWSGTPFTTIGCYRVALNTFGVGHPHLLWAACSSVPPKKRKENSYSKEFLLIIQPKPTIFQSKATPSCPVTTPSAKSPSPDFLQIPFKYWKTTIPCYTRQVKLSRCFISLEMFITFFSIQYIDN